MNKERIDLIPAASKSDRIHKIANAADSVAEVLGQQAKGARSEVTKVFMRAQVTFWEKFYTIAKKHPNN